MLDFELAEIYGYSTKAFNQQVKNNINKFDEDFRFQITREELAKLVRSKNLTSRDDTIFQGQSGGTRYLPWCFTESGIYMLMTVLRGDLATQQSKALIRTFRAMKDYIIENQDLIGRHKFTQLKLGVSKNREIELHSRAKLNEIDEQIKSVVDRMSDVVMRSEISPFLLDLGKPTEKHEFLILNGEPAKASETHIHIYSQAKKTVYIIDNYVSIKTLRLLQDVKRGVSVIVFSDNLGNKLHASDYADFQTEFPHIPVAFRTTSGIMHDRYIVLDFGTAGERIFHCGASSKDAGKKMTSITEYTEKDVKAAFHTVVNKLLTNPVLNLRYQTPASPKIGCWRFLFGKMHTLQTIALNCQTIAIFRCTPLRQNRLSKLAKRSPFSFYAAFAQK